MYSVVAVICIVGVCAEYGMAAENAVTGRKGTVDIKVSNKGDTLSESGLESKFNAADLYEDSIKIGVNKIIKFER